MLIAAIFLLFFVSTIISVLSIPIWIGKTAIKVAYKGTRATYQKVQKHYSDKEDKKVMTILQKESLQTRQQIRDLLNNVNPDNEDIRAATLKELLKKYGVNHNIKLSQKFTNMEPTSFLKKTAKSLAKFRTDQEMKTRTAANAISKSAKTTRR